MDLACPGIVRPGKVLVSGALALCHSGLPHRYRGEPEKDSQAPHRDGTRGSQEELPMGDLTEGGSALRGEKGAKG